MLDPNVVPGWFTLEDMHVARTLCMKLPKNANVVEIGTFCGRSAATWAKELPDATIYTIDIDLQWDAMEYLNEHHYHGDLKYYKGSPFETLHWVMGHYPNIISVISNSTNVKMLNNIDLIFIDGGHEYDAVKADLQHWYPRLAPNGIICGHDYLIEFFPGLINAVDEFANQNNLMVVTRLPSSMWILEKKNILQLRSPNNRISSGL